MIEWTPEAREEFYQRLKISLDASVPIDGIGDSTVSSVVAGLLETTLIAWAKMAVEPCNHPPASCGLDRARIMAETLMLIPALAAQQELTGRSNFETASQSAEKLALQMMHSAQAAMGLHSD